MCGIYPNENINFAWKWTFNLFPLDASFMQRLVQGRGEVRFVRMELAKWYSVGLVCVELRQYRYVWSDNPLHFTCFGFHVMRIDGVSVNYFQFMHHIAKLLDMEVDIGYMLLTKTSTWMQSLIPLIMYYTYFHIEIFLVHRCGAGGSMPVKQRALVWPHTELVSWVRFFRGFCSLVRQMSGSFRPHGFPDIIWPS